LDYKQPQAYLIFVPKESLTTVEHQVYVGKYIRTTTAGQQLASVPPGELYVIQIRRIVDGLVREIILPLVHQFAAIELCMAAIFTFVIFIMETIGDVTWQAFSVHAQATEAVTDASSTYQG
jgi:hypothetical protein